MCQIQILYELGGLQSSKYMMEEFPIYSNKERDFLYLNETDKEIPQICWLINGLIIPLPALPNCNLILSLNCWSSFESERILVLPNRSPKNLNFKSD